MVVGPMIYPSVSRRFRGWHLERRYRKIRFCSRRFISVGEAAVLDATPGRDFVEMNIVVVQRYELTCYLRGIHEPIYTTISQVDWKSTWSSV